MLEALFRVQNKDGGTAYKENKNGLLNPKDPRIWWSGLNHSDESETQNETSLLA